MIEFVAPEDAVVVEPVDHGHQCVGTGAIVSFAAGTTVVYEFGALEDGEVLGDRGLGDAGLAGERVDGLLAVAGELLEDGSAGGVGERAEDGLWAGLLHRKTITIWLWFVKPWSKNKVAAR